MPLEPKHEAVVCPWTTGNPRHDHQLIFPLDSERLILVWCEYYVRKPSGVARTVYDETGQSGDDLACQISAKISTDRARTWSDKFTLQENIWAWNVKHPNLIRTLGGELIFFMTVWENNRARNVFMKRSPDNGESWSYPRPISEPGWYCNNNDHIVRLSSGRILLPAHGGPRLEWRGGKNEAGEYNTVIHSFVFYSDDEFETWSVSRNTMTAPDRGCHEPSIVELRDGKLLCFLRTTLGRIYKSYSDDQGLTWGKPTATDLKAPDSPPLLKRIPSTGDLLLLWNHVESRSNWPRIPLTAAVSKDEGETWEHFQDIDARMNRDAAYAAVTFLGDEALVTYYSRDQDWSRDCEITLRIYDIEQFCGA